MTGDPVLIAYGVKKARTSSRNIWHRIGKVYPHGVGAGLTVVLDALPHDGRIILLERDVADDVMLEREAIKYIARPRAEKARAD